MKKKNIIKIDLGDDVIAEIKRLKELLNEQTIR